MQLVYLAIELCSLIPWNDDEKVVPEIICSFQGCLILVALEVQHNFICREKNLSVLSNFPSLIHCYVGGIYDIELIINSCPQLKRIIFSADSFGFSRFQSMQNHNLQQLSIKPHFLNVSIPTSFLQLVSAHSIHVVLCTGRLYAEGITALRKFS